MCAFRHTSRLYISACVCDRVSVVSLQARCVPVSDSAADYVLCDGDSEESSVSEAAVWRSRRAFDVRRTGQDRTGQCGT